MDLAAFRQHKFQEHGIPLHNKHVTPYYCPVHHLKTYSKDYMRKHLIWEHNNPNPSEWELASYRQVKVFLRL